MNSTFNITATLDEPVLLTQIVEQIASYGKGRGNHREVVAAKWNTLRTSSTEVFVCGKVALSDGNSSEPPVEMPFTSNFLFTCIKGKKGSYALEWGISMS